MIATTIPDLATFVVCAAIILAGAIGVVTSRNPVHSALMLVMTLFGVAVLFIEEDASFLAAIQVIVYAGAIVVLFLFVIMFLGVDKSENLESEPLRLQRPLAFLLVAVAVAGVLVLASHAHWVTGAHGVAGSPGTIGTNTARLGKAVFTTYLFAFEITAGLLVIAVVGAVVLARRPPRPAPGEGDEPLGMEVAGPAELGPEAVPAEEAGPEEPRAELGPDQATPADDGERLTAPVGADPVGAHKEEVGS